MFQEGGLGKPRGKGWGSHGGEAGEVGWACLRWASDAPGRNQDIILR